jgi:AGZA family xanthine/uracil permease-like MFS transporter
MKNMKNPFNIPLTPAVIRREALAGLTTFMTMSYIIFLQPAILSAVGMDFNAVLVATCLSAVVATLIMGLLANYPIALAPGMGENYFFAFTVVPACAALGLETAAPWQTALGVVAVSGLFFLILSILGLRKAILDAMSPSMKHGAAAGIGLFIAFIGLKNGGIITANPGSLVSLNPDLLTADTLIFTVGLLVTVVLFARKIHSAVLVGILTAAITAVLAGRAQLAIPVSAPPSMVPVFMKLDLPGVFANLAKLLPLIIIFLFMDVFDTIGTLVGVAEQAGFVKDNKLPRAEKAMVADAAGTALGGIFGTSTVTSYIESTTGVESGGRTGLTACFAALFFLIALFFSPFVRMVGECLPTTAPALVIVGAMMMKNVTRIEWNDYGESVPAFLTMIGIPLTFSIADGLALGFISYPLIKLFSGKAKETSWLMITLCIVLLLYFILVRPELLTLAQ